MIQSKTSRLAISRRGDLSSAEHNEFFANLTTDIGALVTGLNSEESNRVDLARIVQDELLSIRNHLSSLLQAEMAEKRREAHESQEAQVTISMHDMSSLIFPSASPASLRAAISPIFGQATVPMNGIEQKFVKLDFRSREIVPPENLYTSVTGTFDKGTGDGSQDYEYDGTVAEGDPTLAFNGMNTQVWAREIAFNVNSDIDNVECELIVHVPEQFNVQANTLVLNTHPWKGVDITSVAIASSINTSFTNLPGFTEELDAGALRLFFPAQQVAMIKVRLRQRHWRQKEGYKVFRYGLEELGLQLIDWDKTWTGAISTSHTFGYYIDTPTGYKFTTLTDLMTGPDFELETTGSRHIHIKVTDDEDATTTYWDSDLDSPPRNSAITLGSGQTRIYVLVTMNFVATSGGGGSPFQVGTSPYINWLSLVYNTEAV